MSNRSLEEQIEDQRIELARMRAALRPFATAVASLDDDHQDGLHLFNAPAMLTLCAGDLRRAKSALVLADNWTDDPCPVYTTKLKAEAALAAKYE